MHDDEDIIEVIPLTPPPVGNVGAGHLRLSPEAVKAEMARLIEFGRGPWEEYKAAAKVAEAAGAKSEAIRMRIMGLASYLGMSVEELAAFTENERRKHGRPNPGA